MGHIKFSLIAPATTGIFIFFSTVFVSCENIQRNKNHPGIADSDIKKGKELAELHCQSCHALPDPSLLDATTWEKGVLPVMGPKIGIFNFNKVRYPTMKYDMNLDKNFYPSQPVITLDEWKNIIDYYTAVAPDTLNADANSQKPINEHLSGFEVRQPAGLNHLPATVMVKVPEKSNTKILLSDAVTHLIYAYDSNLKIVDSINTSTPVVDVEFSDKVLTTCNIGVLNPNNGKYGKGQQILLTSKGKMQADTAVLFRELRRPVQITSTDLNNDGKTDYVVCEFGFLTGALSWMENLGKGEFTRHVLRPLPGAIKAYVDDYNHDGFKDLWVLFAQGEEGVFLFTNKGNGQFDQKEVLRFPPVYGSSYFEFADFNKDGHPDIVYTCGDNADYSIVYKPYHGVYIFMNDGSNHFVQKYFFHINGCYKAIARDFDNDGDLDIATISFFADYLRKPEEGFVYLENTGGLKFSPYSLPESQRGRWLTMDAGDINGDGNIDLVLGNFSMGPAMIKPKYNWKEGPPFIVLQNLGKKQL